MLLGTGRAVITPPIGTFMAGFGFRDKPSDSVLDDLEVRAQWFQEGDKADAVCIVTADLISFNDTLTQEIRTALHKRHGVPIERILLAASHTHSGPVVDADIATLVRRGVEEAVDAARTSLCPVTLHAGRGRLEGYSMNRRHITNGQSHHAPNPGGVKDDEVMVISCRDVADGRVLAVLFHFTCHTTTMGLYCISGDYAGVARRRIEESLGNGSVAGFLPGCFGDVRPACTVIGGTRWRRGGPEDIAAFGQALGSEVIRIVQEGSTPVTPRLFGRTGSVDLPFARQRSREELEGIRQNGKPHEQRWAERLLEKTPPDSFPLSLQRIDLAAEVTLLAMGGEMVCDYGLWIKQVGENQFLIPLGYSNGMVGYVASARQFPEGGYEVDFFVHSSRPMPSRFKPEIENMIKEGVQELLSTSPFPLQPPTSLTTRK